MPTEWEGEWEENAKTTTKDRRIGQRKDYERIKTLREEHATTLQPTWET